VRAEFFDHKQLHFVDIGVDRLVVRHVAVVVVGVDAHRIVVDDRRARRFARRMCDERRRRQQRVGDESQRVDVERVHSARRIVRRVRRALGGEQAHDRVQRRNANALPLLSVVDRRERAMRAAQQLEQRMFSLAIALVQPDERAVDRVALLPLGVRVSNGRRVFVATLLQRSRRRFDEPRVQNVGHVVHQCDETSLQTVDGEKYHSAVGTLHRRKVTSMTRTQHTIEVLCDNRKGTPHTTCHAFVRKQIERKKIRIKFITRAYIGSSYMQFENSINMRTKNSNHNKLPLLLFQHG
jgi:hypothetical protein